MIERYFLVYIYNAVVACYDVGRRHLKLVQEVLDEVVNLGKVIYKDNRFTK